MKKIKKFLTLFGLIAAVSLVPAAPAFAEEIPGQTQVSETEAPFQGVVPGDVKKLKATPKKTTIKLTWNAAENAHWYEIYAVDKKTNETEKIGTTQSTAYTVKDYDIGTKHYFQVYAYNSTGGVENRSVNGSKLVGAKTLTNKPSVPANFMISVYGDRSLTLKWRAVSGADGYYLHQYDKKTGEYTVIKRTSKTEIKLTGLKDGQRYRFAIQSYKKVNGSIVYSNLSDVVEGKAQKFSKLTKQVHGRYYNTVVNATTKATVVKTGKKITVKKGTKVIATGLGSSPVVGMLPNGTKIKIAKNRLRMTGLNTVTTSYDKDVKEAFVNQKGYRSPTKYLIWISQYTLETTVFRGSQGKWKVVRSMPCVIGSMGRTTPGTFALCKRTYDYGGPVIYFSWNSQKNWGNAFHRRVDGNARGAYSHGCVRLGDSDLSYIANNCPMGTTVISY